MTIQGLMYRLNQIRLRCAYAFRGTLHSAKMQGLRKGPCPSVAAVIVGRNDDYMADFKQRLQATVAWNVRRLVREVIFVEWNPPSDRELLSLEMAERFKCLRAYVVPARIHESICQNSRIPLLEYHAKNVGIRRARSPWIVATNADVAFANDTVLSLITSSFPRGTAWTAQRVDISWTEFRRRPIGLIDCMRFKRIIPYEQLGTGDFLLAGSDWWQRARGYDESLVRHRIGCDVRGAAQMIALGACVRKVGSVLHLAHPSSCTEGIRAHHGDRAPLDGLPYENLPDWGLAQCSEKEIGERVWLLD